MSEENKAFVRTFLDAFARGDVETTKAMMAVDHVFHFPFFDGPMDRDAHAGTQAGFVAAIPDLKFEVHDQIAEGDKVATRFTITGTFSEPFVSDLSATLEHIWNSQPLRIAPESLDKPGSLLVVLQDEELGSLLLGSEMTDGAH